MDHHLQSVDPHHIERISGDPQGWGVELVIEDKGKDTELCLYRDESKSGKDSGRLAFPLSPPGGQVLSLSPIRPPLFEKHLVLDQVYDAKAYLVPGTIPGPTLKESKCVGSTPTQGKKLIGERKWWHTRWQTPSQEMRGFQGGRQRKCSGRERSESGKDQQKDDPDQKAIPAAQAETLTKV